MIYLIVATRNKGKIREIKKILHPLPVLSLDDLKYMEEIQEVGNSFIENATIKACLIQRLFQNQYPKAFVLADDSGLEIEALEGRPGIYSARYAGKNATQEDLIKKVLIEMKDIPFEKRSARFVCAMVLCGPGNTIFKTEGYCEGRISFEPIGKNGFGYDPIFLLKKYNYKKTMAEISDEEKNKLSHRRKALDNVKIILRQMNIIGSPL